MKDKLICQQEDFAVSTNHRLNVMEGESLTNIWTLPENLQHEGYEDTNSSKYHKK